MKNIKSRIVKLFVFTFALSITVFLQSISVQAATADDKLKTEEILERHLKSIGTKEARDSVVSIMASGTAQAIARGKTAGETSGLVVIASEAEKNLIGMRFPNNDYPYEKMGYDGKQFTVGFVRPGVRSQLGDFLRENENTFERGILGGVLSTSWELLKYNEKVGKLKCGGTEEIDNLKHYECKYEPKKSDLRIKMYFHPETFRHVRTEYSRVISAGQGLSIDNSSRQSEVRFTMVEEFSDFKEVNGLTLPHQYKITYDKTGRTNRSGADDSVSMEWNMKLTNFIFNEKIDSKEFKVDNF
jgi:hypothetical protein